MRLVDYLNTHRIFLNLKAGNKEAILEQIVQLIVEKSQIPACFKGLFYEKLLEREEIKSTGIGHGLAVPHAIIEEIDYSFVSVAVCPEGIDFQAMDKKPVHIVVTLVGPLKDRPVHLKLLGCIARLMLDPHLPSKMIQATSEEELYRLILENECESES